MPLPAVSTLAELAMGALQQLPNSSASQETTYLDSSGTLMPFSGQAAHISGQNESRAMQNQTSAQFAPHLYGTRQQTSTTGHRTPQAERRAVHSILNNSNHGLQYENQHLRQEVEHLLEQLQEVGGLLQDVERRNENMMHNLRGYEEQLWIRDVEIQKLTANLDDCKDKIFHLQPVQHMTDTDIAEDYERLRNAVEDLADLYFSGHEPSWRRLCQSDWAQWAHNISNKAFDTSSMKLVGVFQEVSITMASYFLFSTLQHQLLRSCDFSNGLNSEMSIALKRLVRSMEHLTDPPRSKTHPHLPKVHSDRYRQINHSGMASRDFSSN